MAKKSKKYEAAQQKAEAQFFEARKKAAEDAASNVVELVEKCPVPYDFPYIENFMAWIGKADEYRTDLPPSRVTVKAEDSMEYAVGVEMIDISEYPPIVKEVARMSFWRGAEIIRRGKSDPEVLGLLKLIGVDVGAIKQGTTRTAIKRAVKSGYHEAKR